MADEKIYPRAASEAIMNNASGAGKWLTIDSTHGEVEGTFVAIHAEDIAVQTLIKAQADYGSDDWAVDQDYATDATGKNVSGIAVGFVTGVFTKITVFSGSVRVQDISGL